MGYAVAYIPPIIFPPTAMNTSSPFTRTLRLAGVAMLLASGLAACNTGDNAGATNVERGSDKISDPGARHPSGGVDSARIMHDTATSVQERQYRNARNSRDRNNDGKAD